MGLFGILKGMATDGVDGILKENLSSALKQIERKSGKEVFIEFAKKYPELLEGFVQGLAGAEHEAIRSGISGDKLDNMVIEVCNKYGIIVKDEKIKGDSISAYQRFALLGFDYSFAIHNKIRRGNPIGGSLEYGYGIFDIADHMSDEISMILKNGIPKEED